MLSWIGTDLEAERWWIAIGTFLCCALWESLGPHRSGHGTPVARWVNNFALYGVCLALVGLIAPIEWIAGLLGAGDRAPLTRLADAGGDAVLLAVGLLLVDLYIYAVHRAQHAVFLLWRFHVVHHADTMLDASTALRHHPLEYLVNAIIGNLLFVALGLPLWVQSCYAMLMLVVGLVQHANVCLPAKLEAVIELVIVGPAMHRAHHSSDPALYNSNFGIVFTCWDRLFGSYRPLSQAEQQQISFGVAEVSAAGHAGEPWAWVQPFLLRRGEQPARRLS